MSAEKKWRWPPKPWGSGQRDMKKVKPNEQELKWLFKSVAENGVPREEVSLATNLPMGTLKEYLSRYRQGQTVIRNSGRPPSIDAEGRKAILEAVALADHNDESLQKTQINDLIVAHRQATQLRQGKAPDVLFSKVSIQYQHDKLGLGSRGANFKTGPRQEAEHDVLSMLSTMVMFTLASALVSCPQLLFNMDATTVSTGPIDPPKQRVYYVKSEQGRDKAVSCQTPSSGRAHVSFKWYNINSAGGAIGDIVLLFQWPSLGPNEYHVFAVEGLTASNDHVKPGYVVFTQSLAGNREFFAWLLERVLGRWIVELQNAYSRNGNKKAVLFLDGEDTQITEFGNPAVKAFFDTNEIQVFKPPASTTRSTQSADAGHQHSEIKRVTAEKLAAKSANAGLKAVLQDFFKPEGKGEYWSTARCNVAIDLVVAFVEAARETQTYRQVVSGWKKIGVVPTVCITTIAKQFNHNLTAHEYYLISDDMRNAVNRMKRQGRLSDKELQAHFRYCQLPHIAEDMIARKRPRDELTLHSQRSVAVLHHDVHQEQVVRRAALVQKGKERQREKRAVARQRISKQALNGKKQKKNARPRAKVDADYVPVAPEQPEDDPEAQVVRNLRRRVR